MYSDDFPEYITGRQSFLQSPCEPPLRLHILIGEFQKYFLYGRLDKVRSIIIKRFLFMIYF